MFTTFILIILSVIAACGFLYLSWKAFSIRKGDSDEYLEAYVALAGSGIGPRTLRFRAPVLCSEDGKKDVDSEYSAMPKYIVQGNSMMLCGIKENDIVAVLTDCEKIEYPAILLIKKANPSPDSAAFKIRRTWAECNDAKKETVNDALREILSSEMFAKVKKEEAFPGEKAVIENFQHRYQDFIKEYSTDKKVIISTTLHNSPNEKDEPYYGKIMFSIHPFDSIVGVVKAAFRN